MWTYHAHARRSSSSLLRICVHESNSNSKARSNEAKFLMYSALIADAVDVPGHAHFMSGSSGVPVENEDIRYPRVDCGV